MTRAGIEEGNILPRWGVALNLMLFPSRILWVIGCHVYDAMRDSIIIGKVRLSLYQLKRTYSTPSPAGLWFRVAGHDANGYPRIEIRDDNALAVKCGSHAVERIRRLADDKALAIGEAWNGLNESADCIEYWVSRCAMLEDRMAELERELRTARSYQPLDGDWIKRHNDTLKAQKETGSEVPS